MAWAAPIGIPTPGGDASWGSMGNPIDLVSPAAPNPWNAEVAGYYFVDFSAAAGPTYGTPAVPRKTIPLTLPKGSAVFVRGNYDQTHGSPNQLISQGTNAVWSANLDGPVWLLNYDGTARIRKNFICTGTFCFVDGLIANSELADGVNYGTFQLGRATQPSNNSMVRNATCTGHNPAGTGGLNAYQSFLGTQQIFYHNDAHNVGDYQAAVPVDRHGFAVTASDHVWIVDNVAYQCGGDGSQINGSGTGGTGSVFVWVGRNDFYQNCENSLDIKDGADIIVSQNKFHFGRGSTGGNDLMGYSIVVHQITNPPTNVWIIFNEIFDSNVGLSDSRSSGGTTMYVIGNFFHDINWFPTTFASVAQTAWNPATLLNTDNAGWAVHLRGGAFFGSDNVILNCMRGVGDQTTTGTNAWTNGIIAFIQDFAVNNTVQVGAYPANANWGWHIYTQGSTDATTSDFSNCRCYDSHGTKIWWGAQTDRTMAYMLANSTKFVGGSETDPLVTSHAIGTYPGGAPFNAAMTSAGIDAHLLSTSSCVDTGLKSSAYDTFFARYAISITVDFDGHTRPTNVWDLGAYEYGGVGGGSGGPPPQVFPPVTPGSATLVQPTVNYDALFYLPLRVVDLHDPNFAVLEDTTGRRHIFSPSLLATYVQPVAVAPFQAAPVVAATTAFDALRQRGQR